MKRYSFVLLVVAPTLLLAIFVYSSNRPKLHNDAAMATKTPAPLTRELAVGSIAASESSAVVSSMASAESLSSVASSTSFSSSHSSSVSSAPYSSSEIGSEEIVGEVFPDAEESASPKIDLPALKTDAAFDYKNAAPEQLKQAAVADKSVSVFTYVEAIQNKIFSFKDANNREKIYRDSEEGMPEVAEMRDYYMQALQDDVK